MNLVLKTKPTFVLNQIFLCLFAALIVFTPVYAYQKMVLLLLCFLLWYVTAIALDNAFLKESVPVVFLLVSVVALDLLRGYMIDAPIDMLRGVNKMPTFVWILVFQFYSKQKRRVHMEPLIIILLLLLVISAAFTLKGNIEHPGASRVLATSLEYYQALRKEYRASYIGGYDLIYGLVFLLMPLVLLARQQKRKKVFFYAAAAFFVVNILFGAYMLSILFMVFMLAFSFMRKPKFVRIAAILIVCCLLFIAFQQQIFEAMTMFAESIGSETLATRAEQLFTGDYFKEYGDQSNRLTLYVNAIKNWLDNPFWGDLQGNINVTDRRSGHSAMLGWLELYGVFSIVYFAFFRQVYRIIQRAIANQNIKKYYKLYFLFCLLFVFLNGFDSAYGVGFVMLFFGPLLFLRVDENTRLRAS